MFQRNRATSVSLPAPVGGWNARDSLADMAEDDAVTLTNLFPSTTSVDVRSGYTEFSTGYGSAVETLMQYAGGATSELFAIAGGEIFDATAGGAIGAAEVTGLTNSRWQYINLATAAGTFIELQRYVMGRSKREHYRRHGVKPDPHQPAQKSRVVH
jgi:hypothetical protein